MKRISTILLATAIAVPSFAQLNGTGFYRVQNADSKRYATVVDNKAKKPSTSTSNIELKAINTIAGFDNIATDPGSIIFIEENSGKGYTLKAQGMDSYKVTNLYLKIRNINGTYQAYGEQSGVKKYLHEAYDDTYDYWYFTSATKNSDGSSRSKDWNIIPVKDEDGKYFAIKPELEIDGKYYTTLYTSFSYKLNEGMKALYIKQTIGEKAELAEIEGTIVPGSTPVIIECTSDKIEENKVTPIDNKEGNLENKLKGVFFCNVIKSATTGKEKTTLFNWNTTEYDEKTMRVIGNVNGKLGFVKAEDLKYLPANKAFLQVSDNYTAANIELVDAKTYAEYASTYTNISNISTENTNKRGIYLINGRKLNNTDNLPAGVYVIDGKKTIIRK